MNKLIAGGTLFILLLFSGSILFGQDKGSLFSKDSVQKYLDKKIGDRALDSVLKNKPKQLLQRTGIDKYLKKDSLKKKPTLGFKDFYIENAGQYVKPETPGPFPSYINNITISGQLMVKGFPLNINLASNYDAFNNFNSLDNKLMKMSFNRNSLTQAYRAKLVEFQHYKQDKLSGRNIEGFLKDKVQQQALDKMKGKAGNQDRMMKILSRPEQVQQLLQLNPAELKQKLYVMLSDSKATAERSITGASDSLRTVSGMNVNQEVDVMFEVIQDFKQDMADNGIDQQKIGLFQKFLDQKITEQDLGDFFVNEMSKEQKFSGLGKYYSKVQTLKAGSFGEPLPGSSMNNDLFLSGFMVTVKTFRGPVTVGLGNSNDLKQPKDLEFSSSLYATPKLFSFVSVPTTNFSVGKGQLSWVGVYDKQFSSTIRQSVNAMPKNNLVFTLSQDLKFNHVGKFTVDVSKSATEYKTLALIGPDQLMIDRNTQGNYFRDDFMETLSLGVNHEFEAPRSGFNSRMYVNYAGLGFQNPGQQAFGNVNLRFGGNLKKKLLQNKLTLNLRSDIKNTPISAETGAHWRNYNVQVDSRYKISKIFNVNLKYINNGVNKVTTASSSVYQSEKFQMDFSANYKMASRQSFSHFTLGKQVMNNVGIATPIDFLTANYAQTVMFNGFSLTGNVLYNKELNTQEAIGNLLNTDAACQYTLFRTLNLSSGVTYLNNAETAEQIGLRQNIQMMVRKHFDINAYVDVKKNLINPLYPDLYSTGRAEFSIRYYFDRQ
ncbi:hypothetical protein PBAL39_13352 [Pedobacter sp. BAL39]|uniref:hypothetical protein n=1 Tax=Pedobacter sp. BAL39 TaxID=391596 RepID=UPI000155986F|nr:hypothetical protein [Pedobacter sp. BAL39]EDM35221.1 hypothetical protein PBAL39_13352 [Pedobacter sp. BAL39]